MKKLSIFIVLLSLPTSLQLISADISSAKAMDQNTAQTEDSDQSDEMSQSQVAQVIAQAGFPKQVVPIITCLAEHESRFNPKAVNENSNHSRDYGLLQINSIWLKKDGCNANNTSVHQLLDPKTNAQCALKIYKTQGLTAWTTYKTFKNTCLAYKVKGFKANVDIAAL